MRVPRFVSYSSFTPTPLLHLQLRWKGALLSSSSVVLDVEDILPHRPFAGVLPKFKLGFSRNGDPQYEGDFMRNGLASAPNCAAAHQLREHPLTVNEKTRAFEVV